MEREKGRGGGEGELEIYAALATFSSFTVQHVHGTKSSDLRAASIHFLLRFLVPVVAVGGIKSGITVRREHFNCDQAGAQSPVGVGEPQVGALTEVALPIRL